VNLQGCCSGNLEPHYQTTDFERWWSKGIFPNKKDVGFKVAVFHCTQIKFPPLFLCVFVCERIDAFGVSMESTQTQKIQVLQNHGLFSKRFNKICTI